MGDDSLASPLSKQSSLSGFPATPSNHRRERGAIAAQACDTCRSRKQRCDEQRPKCGTCVKFKLECNYREPQPTKKDRTLLEILERVKGLEGKIDHLSSQQQTQQQTQQTQQQQHQEQQQHYPHQHPQQQQSYARQRNSPGNPEFNYGPVGTFGGSSEAVTMSPPIMDHMGATSTAFPGQAPSRSTSTSDENHYAYVASCHQMMGWPVFQHLLESIRDKVPGLDPSKVESEMPATVLGVHERYGMLPLSADGSQGQLKTMGPAVSLQNPGGIPLNLSSLNWETMQRLSKAYFDTFNFLFPLLDRHTFLVETLPTLLRDGYNESTTSTLALLVFALGEQAIAGSQGIPIRSYNGQPSGIKGGTAREPPALVLFNEARRRMGFNLTECSLENVQIYALAGIYYGACSHTMELWRMTTSASRAVQLLVHCKPLELTSSREDIIRRAFWHCSMMETCMHLELGLPLSGLDSMEQHVGVPIFNGHYTQEDYIGNQATHFQEHLASQIVLRRLMSEFDSTLSQVTHTPPPSTSSGPFSHHLSVSSTPSSNVNPITIKHLAQQLDQWRGMLPMPLRWDEESPGAFPNPAPGNEVFGEAGGFPRICQPATPTALLPTPTPSTNSSTHGGHSQPPPSPSLMFTTDLDTPPVAYPYALDIQVALLRTRYYYNKYILHRPFLYKALHHPDAVTAEDAQGVAFCLRAALKWPITMSPACARKRLIPCLFVWTQNVMGVLMVLHLASITPVLQRVVRGGLCGETFEMEASETVGLCFAWLRDLKEVDKAALWNWELVRAVYGLE